jgi:hypothetical protein
MSVLPGLHPRDVVGERRSSARRIHSCGAGEPQQRQQSARGWPASSPRPSFSTSPKSFQNVAYFSGSSLASFASKSSARARERAAHRLDVGILLQQLARHVERQVVRVDHAAYEAQVKRQELLGVVHDEHAPHVELQPARPPRAATDRTAHAPARTASDVYSRLPSTLLWLQASGSATVVPDVTGRTRVLVVA